MPPDLSAFFAEWPIVAGTLGFSMMSGFVLFTWWCLALFRSPTNYQSKTWYEDSQKSYSEYLKGMSGNLFKLWLLGFPLYFLLGMTTV